MDLIEEEQDLAIRIGREMAPGLAARPLCAMRYVLVATPAYLAQHGEPASPSALAGHSCICLRHSELGGSWSMQRAHEILQVVVPTRITINNSAAVMAAVEAHGGIGMVSDFAAQPSIDAGRVRRVLEGWDIGDSHTRSVQAVYVPGRHIALKIRVFIDYLTAAEPPQIRV